MKSLKMLPRNTETWDSDWTSSIYRGPGETDKTPIPWWILHFMPEPSRLCPGFRCVANGTAEQKNCREKYQFRKTGLCQEVQEEELLKRETFKT